MHQTDEPIAAGGNRPSDGWMGQRLRRLPKVTHVPISWTHICTSITWRQRVIARLDLLVSLAVVLGAVAVGHAWIMLFVNPITAVAVILSKVLHVSLIALGGCYVWLAVMVIMLRRKYRRMIGAVVQELDERPTRSDTLEAAAINEEVWFREGAETWSWWQRLKSAWLFAIAHNTGWWYGVGLLVIMQFVSGLVYTMIYLRTYSKTGSREAALRDTAAVHFHHNRMIARPLSMATIGTAVLVAVFLLTHK